MPRLASLALVAWSLACQLAQAQPNSGAIRGLVVDSQTAQPLAQARVSTAGRAADTTPDGRFVLERIPGGRTRLEVSLVGYGLLRRDVDVPANGVLDLTLPLVAGTGTYTETVQVDGALFVPRERGVPGQMSIGSAELQNLRSLLADDPVRAVQTLPGVGGSDDFRSDFSVRASDYGHVGVTLDGVSSPLLAHTVRTALDTGSLAMINSDVVDGVSLLAGSYPQRYGNRTGGHVDFRSREGSRERNLLRVSVSAINASLVAEGPLGRERRGSWLVSGRKSYIDWLIRRIDPDTTGTFGFLDGQGKLVYDLSPRHTLQLTMVAGRSRYDEHGEDPGPSSLEVGFNRSVMGALTLRSTLSPATVVTQQVSAISNRFSNHNATMLPLDTGGDDEHAYRADLTTAAGERLTVEGGVQYERLRATRERHFYAGSGLRLASDAFARGTSRAGAYALARVKPFAALTLSPGARVDRWALTGEHKVSPWLQAELVLPRSFVVAAGTGLHRQAPEIAQADGPEGAVDPRVQRARHVDAGLGQQWGAYRWQATLFRRDESDMLRLAGAEARLEDGDVVLPDPFARYVNAVSGRVSGLELSLQRRNANGISGWIGYSFVQATDEDRITGETFAANAEQRHLLNVYGHYRIDSRLSLSARFRAATNTPLAGYYTERDGGLFLSDLRNTTRLPFYSRLDLRANRTFDVAAGRLTLFVEVINAYHRRNLRGREDVVVNRRTGAVRRATDELLPIVPSAGFLIEF